MYNYVLFSLGGAKCKIEIYVVLVPSQIFKMIVFIHTFQDIWSLLKLFVLHVLINLTE